MRINDYTRLLGLNATDEAVEKMFRDLGVRRRPKLVERKSPYEVHFPISSQGIRLYFTERNFWDNLAPATHGKSRDLVFNEIAITAGIPEEMRQYDGEMPFGLSWDDDRSSARAKMAALGHGDVLHSYKRDSWWLPDHRVRITYQPGNLNEPEQPGIYEITLSLPRPPREAPVQRPKYPTMAELYALFGKSARSAEFRQAFSAFNPDDLIAAVPHEAVNRRHQHGFELYFDRKRQAGDGSYAFAGITMTRDQLGDYQRWHGPLPFDLDFADSPAVLEDKIGQPATQWGDEYAWGYARWFLPDQLLWVTFDSLDNRLETVSVLAPGYRDDLRAQSDD